MVKVFLFLLLGISGRSLAQVQNYSIDQYISDSLMDTNPFGVYLTHEDFLSGKPFLKERFELRERTPGGQSAFYNDNPYVLKVFDVETNSMKRFTEPFWCAFNSEGMMLTKDRVLYRLVYSGRFNICTGTKWNHSNSGTTNTLQEERYVEILDFKTGIWYSYSVTGMKRLLINTDLDLYNEFVSDPKRKKKLGIYFKKLNGV